MKGEVEARKIATAFGVTNLKIESEEDFCRCWGMIVEENLSGVYFESIVSAEGRPHSFEVDLTCEGVQVLDATLDPFAVDGWEQPEQPVWDFVIYNAFHVLYMVRGLINYGFDAEMICVELNYELTAHERLEWQLEYEARIGANT